MSVPYLCGISETVEDSLHGHWLPEGQETPPEATMSCSGLLRGRICPCVREEFIWVRLRCSDRRSFVTLPS